jgi:hypothetical protein
LNHHRVYIGCDVAHIVSSEAKVEEDADLCAAEEDVRKGIPEVVSKSGESDVTAEDRDSTIQRDSYRGESNCTTPATDPTRFLHSSKLNRKHWKLSSSGGRGHIHMPTNRGSNTSSNSTNPFAFRTNNCVQKPNHLCLLHCKVCIRRPFVVVVPSVLDSTASSSAVTDPTTARLSGNYTAIPKGYDALVFVQENSDESNTTTLFYVVRSSVQLYPMNCLRFSYARPNSEEEKQEKKEEGEKKKDKEYCSGCRERPSVWAVKAWSDKLPRLCGWSRSGRGGITLE